MDSSAIKKALGKRAAALVQDGMTVGLGTGSTAECFIESLTSRVQQEKIRIQAVSSSERSAKLAASGGIPVIDLNRGPKIDLTVDGADEIDPQKRLIKGAGGALLREKILASASREMIVIADETKLVKSLGKTKLPVEIVPYGAFFARQKIEALGCQSIWRKGAEKVMLADSAEHLFITDNGHLLLDLVFPQLLGLPEKMHEKIKAIPGVVDTGLFFHLAKRIFIGYADGRIEEF